MDPVKSTPQVSEAVLPLLVCLVTVPLLLVPFFPQTMFHWDEYQLAYGVIDFDLTRHHPHPPGYYLFVCLGRLVHLVVPDANTALRFVSVGAATGFVLSIVASLPGKLARLQRWLLTVAAVALVLASPLLFHFGVAGLTYTAEGAAWTGILLAFTRVRDGGVRGRSLVLLAFACGLAGGVRQTLIPWSLLAAVAMALRHRDWMGPKQWLVAAGAACAGIAVWFVPLLIEAGGWDAYRSASAGLTAGNIWAKSIFVASFERAVRVRTSLMLGDLWSAMGTLLPVVIAVFVQRVRTRSESLVALDPLLFGAAVSYAFYAVLIYDTAGYMVACVMPVAAYALLGVARWSLEAKAPMGKWALPSLVVLGVASLPLQPRQKPPRGNAYTVYFEQDAIALARFRAVRDRYPAESTVLVTSQEYWTWGLRHVGHYLPRYTTVQLMVDEYFEVVDDARPYLASHDRGLEAVGPNPLDLASLLPEPERLEHVLYMVPYDIPQFVHPACHDHFELLTTSGQERILVLPTRAYARIEVVDSRLVCHPKRPDGVR